MVVWYNVFMERSNFFEGYLPEDGGIVEAGENIEGYPLNNLTLILSSFACGKNCPYCISKNSNRELFPKKDDNLDRLNVIFDELQNSGMYFDKFVISGNGEPSLYSIEDLTVIAEAIATHPKLFNKIRIQTSGNLFFEDEKFELFNNLFGEKLEINLARVSFDNSEDMQVLGYDRDYTKTDNFKNAANIKVDLLLTKDIDPRGFFERAEEFYDAYPNITKINLKHLMAGKDRNSPQANWVLENAMNLFELLSALYQVYGDVTPIMEGRIFGIGATGDYEKDVVLNCGQLQDYESNSVGVDDIKNISEETKDIYWHRILYPHEM